MTEQCTRKFNEHSETQIRPQLVMTSAPTEVSEKEKR